MIVHSERAKVMKTVSAAEFCNSFRKYQGHAENEPLEVISDGKVAGYFISAACYDQIRKVVAASRRAWHPNELPPHLQAAVLGTQMDSRHDELNALSDLSE